MTALGRPVVHEIVGGGFCRICGEVREWLEATDAEFVEVSTEGG